MTTQTAKAAPPLDWSRYFRPAATAGEIKTHDSIGRCPAWLAWNPCEKVLAWTVLARASDALAVHGLAVFATTIESLVGEMRGLLDAVRLLDALDRLARDGLIDLHVLAPDRIEIIVPSWRRFERAVAQ